MDHALAVAKERGHGAVILLGDAPYYARFGFSALKTGELSLPGPFERDRLLGLELRDGALDGAWGMIVATGAPCIQASRRAEGAAACRAGAHAEPDGPAPARRSSPRSCVRLVDRQRHLVRRWVLPPPACDVPAIP